MKGKEKGDLLEHAVQMIENLIFAINPAFKESEIVIERNKIIIVNGVKHEIDLYVKILPGNGYDSVFIFECKNWDHASIGKNEILQFGEKISVCNAQKGFFIAKKYGKYGIAQAKLNTRMELLVAAEYDLDLTPFPVIKMVYRDRGQKKVKIFLYPDDYDPQITDQYELKKEDYNDFHLDNKQVNGNDYFLELADEICENKLKTVNTQELEEGEYTYSDTSVHNISDVLKIVGKRINRVEITVEFKIQIKKPIVRTGFNIGNRGRYLRSEYTLGDHGDLALDLAMVMKTPNNQ